MGCMPGGMRPFCVSTEFYARYLSPYAAGLISAAGTFGEAVGAVVAVGVVEASGVALGFAFSSDAFTASSSTREV